MEAARAQSQLSNVYNYKPPKMKRPVIVLPLIAEVITQGDPLEGLPACGTGDFALNFFDGLGEARLVAEDRIVTRTYIAIIIAAVLGFSASMLVAIPAFAARQAQEWVTLALLAGASLVAIFAMVALIITLAGNARGFMQFGQTYNYGGHYACPIGRSDPTLA